MGLVTLNCFISRPMSGVSYQEDCDLCFDIMVTAKEAGIPRFRIMNTWSGPAVPLRVKEPRLWRLGRAISQMAEADIVIFVDGCWNAAKGCAVELEAYRLYKDVYRDQWEAYIYDPKTGALRLFDLKEA